MHQTKRSFFSPRCVHRDGTELHHVMICDEEKQEKKKELEDECMYTCGILNEPFTVVLSSCMKTCV